MEKLLTDDEIIAVIQSPKKSAEAALRQLYAQNRAAVNAMVVKGGGSSDMAKDVMQEAMLTLYENIQQDRFKAESKLSSYLYSIARFQWINRNRRVKLEREKVQQLPRPVHTEEPTIDADTEERLKTLFSVLGIACQRVLIASFYHGYDMETIAQQMGYANEQIARNKKYQCLKKLKSAIRSRNGLLDIFNRQ